MSKKPNLPAEVHDHFRKANILHGYVQESLEQATKHSLEIGQELLAAKTTIPHGRWESECERLFDGSLRTAQFYMAFSKHVSALPKAQASALLVLEGTLDGAAKAARKAVQPPPPTSGGGADPPDAPKSPETVAQPEPPTGSSDATAAALEAARDAQCPNCGGTDFDEDGDCAKCHEPEVTKPPKKSKPPKQYPKAHWFKQYDQAIGPVCRLVDKIASEVGGKKNQAAVQDHLNDATEEMMLWMGVEKK